MSGHGPGTPLTTPAWQRYLVGPLQVPQHATRDWAARIAALTRAAYRDSDPLPGLPAPDGTHDTTELVAHQLDHGMRPWVAQDHAGEVVGALRVAEETDGVWEVGRVAVSPTHQNRGVARALLAAVEAQARARGIWRLRLNAVVERCLPPVYQRLGYRVRRHWPSPDKPLTEVTMDRRPGEAGPPAWAWTDTVLPGGGLLVSWFVVPGAVIAMVSRTADALGTLLRRGAARLAQVGYLDVRLAGVDWWRETDHHPRWLESRLAEEPGLATTADRIDPARHSDTAVVRFDRTRAGVPAHLMPRTLHTRLLALCRFAPGNEARIPLTERGAR